MAGRIPEEKVSEIRGSLDIVDVVGEYVQLKKQGRNYFGLCPFHGENTPSFSVSPDKQIFHCFGCGAGGNIFSFLMDLEGIGFQEAAAKLASKAGVELEIDASSDAAMSNVPPEERPMLEAHELLAKFYHHLLVNTKEGGDALEYLQNRGFTKEGIEKFQIGYSLPIWDFAANFLEKRGFSGEVMEKAGLIIKRDQEQGFFDRFRNRIMFPLADSRGRIVGFSARALSADDHPKYLNTPETAIFNKSSLLYNYYQARNHIRKQGQAVLFEGFADVIAASGAGVLNGIAVMGTSLTDQHIQQIRRIADSVILCFDSDNAGREAAYRAGNMLYEKGIGIQVAVMPKGMDPDDYIRSHGPEMFQQNVIGESLTWMAFKMQYFRQGKNLQHEGDQLKYIEEILREISRLDNAVERDHYLRQVSGEFSLSLEALNQQLREIPKEGKRPHGQEKRKPTAYVAPQAKRILPAHATAERRLLAHMLRSSDAAYKVRQLLGGTAFHIDEHQAILTYLLAFYEEGNEPDTSQFLDGIQDSRLRKVVTEIEMMPLNEEQAERELEDYVRHVLDYPKWLKIKEKQHEQKEAERRKDFAVAVAIAQEIIELKKSLS